MTSLNLLVRSFPLTPDPEQVVIWVQVGIGSKEAKTRQVVQLQGVERDFLNTLVEEITSTFMYGETPRDVVRAASAVKTLAKRHARDCEF